MNELETILYFEIQYIILVKILIETFNKLSEELRLVFTRYYKNNNYVLEISCTNSKKTFFVKGKFDENFITKYKINRDKIDIMVNVNDMLKIIKSLDKSDSILIFYIDKKDIENLVIKFKKNISIDNIENNDDSELI